MTTASAVYALRLVIPQQRAAYCENCCCIFAMLPSPVGRAGCPACGSESVTPVERSSV